MSFDIVAGVLSDPGCERPANEDHGVFIRPASPTVLAAKGVLAVVADGMGGYSGGEIASRMAVETIGRRYYDWDGSCEDALTNAFKEANQSIYMCAQSNEQLRGMGTTCTALVLKEGLAYSAHVGDSRLYMIRGGQVYSMTETHSVVMEQVRAGLLTLDQARQHDERNVILRSLGTRPEVEPSVWQAPLPVRSGDNFVLCSDGLYDVLEDEEIRAVVETSNPFRACENLIQLARSRGAPDNVTAVVVSIQEETSPRKAAVPLTHEAEALT